MLVLLPPSEKKAEPSPRAAPLDLESLSFPELTEHRARVLDALVRVSTGPSARARAVLKITAGQQDELDRNAVLLTAPASKVAQLYTGVLYDNLDLASLPDAAKRRATNQLVVASALFGALKLTDRVPAYRLSGGVTLPRIGVVTTSWRTHLDTAIPQATGPGLVLDLRSSAYSPMWQPAAELAERTITVRVLHERRPGDRTSRVVVSHFNKATKGRLVRELLVSGERPRTPEALAEIWTATDRAVEIHEARRGRPRALDVVVAEV